MYGYGRVLALNLPLIPNRLNNQHIFINTLIHDARTPVELLGLLSLAKPNQNAPEPYINPHGCMQCVGVDLWVQQIDHICMCVCVCVCRCSRMKRRRELTSIGWSHTHIRPYTHTPIHTYAYTHIRPYTHTPIHAYVHTHPHTPYSALLLPPHEVHQLDLKALGVG